MPAAYSTLAAALVESVIRGCRLPMPFMCAAQAFQMLAGQGSAPFVASGVIDFTIAQ
jgi:hypothetical protein